jgi:glycosyltransferase involved in cell wall biosynthesis
MSAPLQVVVAHKGSREHFLAARALYRKGMLAALVTDWYSPISPGLAQRLKTLSPGLARALGAQAADLPRDRIRAMNGFGIYSRWSLARAERAGHLMTAMTRDDERFARRVARLPLPDHQAFLGFSYAALEALQAAQMRGALTLVDQIDPGRVEWDLVREESLRWPAYGEPMAEAPDGYYERARLEWSLADVTLVNSEWSRTALIQQGAPRERIEVIPLAYEAEATTPVVVERTAGGLTVLWLGSVILRKGIAYLVEAARELASEPVKFLVAGPIGISEAAMRQAPANMQWLGAVPRSEAHRLYRAADVFVLPTLSDGFAITQVEALAHGVPVVATPNCGTVVNDGRTGFLVPARDARALASALRRFIREPGLAQRMRPACLTEAARYSVAAYADRLESIMKVRRATQTVGRSS